MPDLNDSALHRPFSGPSKEEGKGRELVTRGLFIGDDAECFFKAAALSIQVGWFAVPNQ